MFNNFVCFLENTIIKRILGWLNVLMRSVHLKAVVQPQFQANGEASFGTKRPVETIVTRLIYSSLLFLKD